jgi:hypothetical protein
MFKMVFILDISVGTSNVDQVRRNACKISTKGEARFISRGNVSSKGEGPVYIQRQREQQRGRHELYLEST